MVGVGVMKELWAAGLTEVLLGAELVEAQLPLPIEVVPSPRVVEGLRPKCKTCGAAVETLGHANCINCDLF